LPCDEKAKCLRPSHAASADARKRLVKIERNDSGATVKIFERKRTEFSDVEAYVSGQS